MKINDLYSCFLLSTILFLAACSQQNDSESLSTAATSAPATNVNASVASGPAGTWDVRWETVSFVFANAADVYGELVITKSGETYIASLYDEKIPVEINGDNIEFTLNEGLRSETSTRIGQVTLHFSGSIKGDRMEGTLTRTDGVINEDVIGMAPKMVKHTEGAAPGFLPETLALAELLPISFNNLSSQWAATRVNTEQRPDISGIWTPRPEMSNSWLQDFQGKLTEEAIARRGQWKPYEDPALRCASAGMVRISGWPLPFDIVQSDRMISIMYEGESAFRRIHTDGRTMPEDHLESGMGYSVGEWTGNVLEVETRWLNANMIGALGIEHRGDETVISERIKMTEDGKFLRLETTLVDPLTWKEPLYRITVWERDMDMELVPYECDGYTFFNGLYQDGRDTEYFKSFPKY